MKLLAGVNTLGAFLWVKAAITPGAFSAALVSMDLMRPLAIVSDGNQSEGIGGSLNSKAYLNFYTITMPSDLI
jgi:hypothetical protein